MFKFKKGDMSINTVVVAAIALIVLVVLTAIFVGRMNTTVDKTNKNDEIALGRVCLQPKDAYSSQKCVPISQCLDPWQRISSTGTATGSSDWIDCPAGDNREDPKVCCGLQKVN